MLNNENIKGDLVPIEYDPFEGPEIIRIVPAIEPQLEIWVSCMMGGEDSNRSYNESVSLQLSGVFDRTAMESALGDIPDRHEILRASFSSDGRQIMIYKALPLNLLYEDLSDIEPDLQRSRITEFAKKDADTSFDLLNGPLFRVALFKLSETEHSLKITAHHIVCDGWSLGIILSDISKLYSAYAKGEKPNLPEAYQFSQYAEDYLKFSETDKYKKNEKYWVDKFSDVPVLNMPTDFPRPASRTFKSNRYDHEMDRHLVSLIKTTGMKAGCSFVSTMLSAFEIFLYRLTGQNDIVLGLPAAGQSTSDEYAFLVGHCVHLLPLRSNPNGDITFSEYLKQRKTAILNDYDHQEMTFGRLLKKLKIARDPSRIPLVPVTFNIDIGLDNGVNFHKLKHKTFYEPRGYENFELFVNAMDCEQSLILEWSYNIQLFKPATVQRMVDEFEQLLRSFGNAPDMKINEIPFLRMPENSFAGFSATMVKYKTIVEYFLEQVEKTPGKTALVFLDQTFTYKQLNEKSNQLAHYLIKNGVTKETLVPICIKRSAEMIIAILGVLKAGGAYVPIDPEYPSERISFMIEDCAADLILRSNECRKKIAHAKNLKIISLDELQLGNEPATLPDILIDVKQLAYIIYTSGSTGKPKGVMIDHRNVVSVVKGVDYVHLKASDVLLSTGSFSFDATTFEYWGMLLNGGELVMCTDEILFNSKLLAEEFEKRKVNIVWFTSSLLNQWVDVDITIFKSLETVLAGGEKLSEKHIEKLRNTYPSLTIINGYSHHREYYFFLNVQDPRNRNKKCNPNRKAIEQPHCLCIE